MTANKLIELERQAAKSGLLLRVQVRRPFGLWAMRLVVAKYMEPQKIRILGEMKAWAYRGERGLQLDTMRVNPNSPSGTGHLVWAATMAWALESTPCRQVRLLAIRDDDRQHISLVRYFKVRGFTTVREVGASPADLLLRIVWGGAGNLMVGNCTEIFNRSCQLWESSEAFKLTSQ